MVALNLGSSSSNYGMVMILMGPAPTSFGVLHPGGVSLSHNFQTSNGAIAFHTRTVIWKLSYYAGWV